MSTEENFTEQNGPNLNTIQPHDLSNTNKDNTSLVEQTLDNNEPIVAKENFDSNGNMMEGKIMSTTEVKSLQEALDRVKSFQELRLNTELISSLFANGYEKLTDTQSCILLSLVKGKSMLVESEPGSGKMTALSILLIQRCVLRNARLQGLVMTGSKEYSSAIELVLNLLSEEATAINLDELEDAKPGEIADHQFMIGSEASLGLLYSIIDSIKHPIILCLYNVNVEPGDLMDKLALNLAKFNQIVLMRDQNVTLDYTQIPKLLDNRTLYYSNNMPVSHVNTVVTILEGTKESQSKIDAPTNPISQPQQEQSPNLEIFHNLNSGEKLIDFFQRHNLSLTLPTFYIFVFHYLLKGVSVVQTGYKAPERANLLCLVAKEFDRHLTIPVQVVICNDGRDLNGSKLFANQSVYSLKDEESLNHIPNDRTIVVASVAKTLSVLKSFPKLFQSTGRILIFFNTQPDRLRAMSDLLPEGVLFLAMLTCNITSVANDINTPFIHVGKQTTGLQIHAYSGAEVTPDELACLEKFSQIKSSPNAHPTPAPVKQHTPTRTWQQRAEERHEDSHTMPNIVSVNLLQTISAKHGMDPKGVLHFYPEVFSFSIRGDHLIMIGFSSTEYTPIANIVALERVNAGAQPGCQVLLYYDASVKQSLTEHPNCTRLIPANEDSILDVCPLVCVSSVTDIVRLYKTQHRHFVTSRKLVVLIGVRLDECVELLADQIMCQFMFVLSESPTDEYLENLPVTFVRFLNKSGSVRIEKVGRDESLSTQGTTEESSPDLTEQMGESQTKSTQSADYSITTPQMHSTPLEGQSTSSLLEEILKRHQADTSENPEFFRTVLSHTFSGNNTVINEFLKEPITQLITMLYSDYCVNAPQGAYTLFCLGSRISDLLLPSFKCPSSLWLPDTKSILVCPDSEREIHFLTISRLSNILNTEFNCLVARPWLIVFIGLSHEETQNCIPFIPLSNQYMFILSIDHPQFQKFMSAPYVVVSKTRRKPVVTEWVHLGKMKSFLAEYKQASNYAGDSTLDSEIAKSSIETPPVKPAVEKPQNPTSTRTLRDVSSSLLNSGRHILLQAARGSGKSTLAFEYTLYNIDRNKKCIQAIFSTPSLFTSVKLFTLLNEYMARNNEIGINAFLHAKGASTQLSSYFSKNNYHLLITTNNCLDKVLSESGIVSECGLIVFDELYDNNFREQVKAILPNLISNSIPHGIQCIFITSPLENTNDFLQIIPVPLFHIRQAVEQNSATASYSIDCYF